LCGNGGGCFSVPRVQKNLKPSVSGGENYEKSGAKGFSGQSVGFTLVELGVALAIMAILTMIAYPTYKNIKNRAYEAEAWAIMQEIRVDVWD
jgi:prepilin-type N-terminal cleavage/methylation domain-containing protein